MAHGPNRAAAKPKASFQAAGGTILKYRHPFLSGQVSGASPVDEIDVSSALRLNDEFFRAEPDQDASLQEVLVDGSIIAITNHLLNGTMTLRAVSTTGLVGTGDFLAALDLVQASKDTVGGTFTVIQDINGKRRVMIFWGVTVKRKPHLILAGNAVPVYQVALLYAGWVQGVSANMEINEKTIWAVGNKTGLTAVYKPYAVQEAENQADFYGGAPVSSATTGVGVDNGDTASGDLDNIAEIPDPLADGMSDTPAPGTVTWPA
jgi:hypothetical protein